MFKISFDFNETSKQISNIKNIAIIIIVIILL